MKKLFSAALCAVGVFGLLLPWFLPAPLFSLILVTGLLSAGCLFYAGVLWAAGGGQALRLNQKPLMAPALKDSDEQVQRVFLIGRLTAGIAHDFNNILTAMLGHVDSLMAQRSVAEAGFAELLQIKKSGLRAASLVRQLLSFSRQQTIQPTRLNLSRQIEGCWILLQRLAGEQVTLNSSVPDDLWVNMDAGQLEQVLLNLVVNARDAMPEGGVVTFQASRVQEQGAWSCRGVDMAAGAYVHFAVEDQGMGIAADTLQHIFDPYFTTKEVGQGTGLGLAMVDGIVQQAGGCILAENSADGGARFVMHLPEVAPPKTALADHTPVGYAEPEAQATPVKAEGPCSVLVAEDDSAVRFVIVNSLRKAGYTVYEAESGDAALTLIAAEQMPLDMVISDIMMPGMDGPSFVGQLRLQYPHVRVMYVSGYADVDERARVATDQQAAFLAKPFTTDHLLQQVAALNSS